MPKKALYWGLLFVLIVSGVGAHAHLSPFVKRENSAVIQAFLSTPGTKIKDAFFANTKIIVVWTPVTSSQEFFVKSSRLYELGKVKPRAVSLDVIAKEALKSGLDKEITEQVEILTLAEMQSRTPSFNPFRLDDPNVVIVQLMGTSHLLAGQDKVYIGTVQAKIFRLMPDCYVGRNTSSMYSYNTANFFPEVYVENFEEPLTGSVESAYADVVSEVITSINRSW